MALAAFHSLFTVERLREVCSATFFWVIRYPESFKNVIEFEISVKDFIRIAVILLPLGGRGKAKW